MKKLLSALIITALVTSCGSPTETEPDKPEFEPYTVGNWLVTSPTEAEFKGESKSKLAMPETTSGDTVIIDQQGKRSLEMVKDTLIDNNKSAKRTRFTMTFADSTFKYQGENNVNVSNTEFSGTRDLFALTVYNNNNTLTRDRYIAEMQGTYLCHKEIPNGYQIHLILFDDSDNILRVYLIKSEGFINVLEDEFCTT